MLKKRTARVRHAKGEDELDPVEEFGQRIAADFIIVHKDSRSTETVVLVVRDEATGYMRTFPLVSRHEDGVVRSLLSFLGKYPSGPCVLFKSDNAREELLARLWGSPQNPVSNDDGLTTQCYKGKSVPLKSVQGPCTLHQASSCTQVFGSILFGMQHTPLIFSILRLGSRVAATSMQVGRSSVV